MIQWYITNSNKLAQFNGEMTAFLKISLMFWKLLTEKIMIMLANSDLVMTNSAIAVTLKDRWCYNVDTTTDVDLCTSNFWKMLLSIQFVFSLCRIPTAELWPSPWKIHVKEVLLGSYMVQAFSCLTKVNSFHEYFSRILALIFYCPTLSGCLWSIRFIRIYFLLRWPHFLSKIVFKDVYLVNCSCLLFLLLTVVSVDYSHYVKISWYSRNIIVNVSWLNCFLTSTVDYMQPHISRCGH